MRACLQNKEFFFFFFFKYKSTPSRVLTAVVLWREPGLDSRTHSQLRGSLIL